MRDLTQKEIDNAPDWATDFFIEHNGYVCYECEDKYISADMTSPSYQTTGVEGFSKPIPRKEFDIEAHDFVNFHLICKNDNNLLFEIDIECFQITKKNSIAFAKHFKLTQDILK